MSSTRKLWIWLAALLAVSFGVLLLVGRDIAVKAPPVPERVVSESGATVFTRADIQRGRQVWQSMGGMQLGSIWGHGGYVAPDWSADWLHRESLALLDQWGVEENGAAYDELTAEQQSGLQRRLEAQMRRNTYDPDTDTITISDERARAIDTVADHYVSLFGNDPATAELRENYAMKNDTVPEQANREAMTAFFWWTAWAAAAERPGQEITYTNTAPS